MATPVYTAATFCKALEEVKELQMSRREIFRRTRDLRSTADKLLETTLRNRDTPEFYSYY